jgi:hypothetical protein
MTPFAEEVQFFDSRSNEPLMRSFIRHPSDIPIEFQMHRGGGGVQPKLKDVSFGGLAFRVSEPVDVGSEIRLSIPGVRPTFEALAHVAWCKPEGDGFTVGVQFLDQDDCYRARMVEQVCHIEHYKAMVLEREGRELSGQEAAREWIAKYAKDFPSS